MADELSRVRARKVDVSKAIQEIDDMTFGTVQNIGPETELKGTPDSLTAGKVVERMRLEAELERLKRQAQDLLNM